MGKIIEIKFVGQPNLWLDI